MAANFVWDARQRLAVLSGLLAMIQFELKEDRHEQPVQHYLDMGQKVIHSTPEELNAYPSLLAFLDDMEITPGTFVAIDLLASQKPGQPS